MNFTIRLSCLCLVTLLFGCATSPRPKVDSQAKNRLFPDGTYRHEVTLMLPNGQQHQFQGVVKLAPERIEVVGLSFFNTTVFRVVDNRKNEPPEVHIYIPQLRPQEAKVREMYGLLKKMLLLPHAEAEKTELPGGGHLSMAGYDERHIPRLLRIQSDKFTVDVKVTSYDF